MKMTLPLTPLPPTIDISLENWEKIIKRKNEKKKGEANQHVSSIFANTKTKILVSKQKTKGSEAPNTSPFLSGLNDQKLILIQV